jgi:hypothetical protein
LRRQALAALVGACAAAGANAADHHVSKPFAGVKANVGTVKLAMTGAQWMLTLSDDFKVPDTPAPHWQVVDGRGNAFLLQRLVVKGDKLNKTIAVPAQVEDIAKVQIWCAFAETLLGEAAFDGVVVLREAELPCAKHDSGKFAGVKANHGTVTHTKVGAQNLLTLSDDFVVPDTPAPHWQVVDSEGTVFLLQRLVVKDGKLNKTIVVPSYVRDVAKVQIWCAFAETLLGEASFAEPVM